MTAPLSNVLRELGYVVLERKRADAFSLFSEATEWFVEMFPCVRLDEQPFSIVEVSSFLDNFLVDAEAFWEKREDGVCESGIWIEKTKSRQELPLEATAVQKDGQQLLTLHSPGPQYSEKVGILQTARSSLLEHEKLLNEIQKKEILLHCIVHDLSQPLSAMRGSFECLSMENDAGRIAKFIDLGKHASEQQEAMIREILRAFSADLQASLDSEKSVNDSPDLLATAQMAARILAPAFEAKGVRLEFSEKIPVGRSWLVQGEETRLCRVFANLLENALRYTPSDHGVTIGLEEDGSYFKAFIDDEGRGLPEELRPAQMFALFGKGKEGGGKAGLGLFFCRITVERWGGSIGCASLPESGSRFWFRLPRMVVAENPSAQGQVRTSMSEITQDKTEKPRTLHVLLADDQEDILMLTTHQLKRSGHEVVAVANGKAALEAAKSRHFDVMILDEEMPVMSGVQAAKSIRELQQNQAGRSVLVALTGNNTPDDRDRLIAAGFDSVLGKPFRLESLEAFLRDLEKQPALSIPADYSGHKEISSLEDLLQRVGGDKNLLRQMIRTFLREAPKRMETIQKALHKKDGKELSARAHALKGSVGIFGAVAAAEHTQSLQELGRIPDFQEAGRVFSALHEEIAKLQENLRGYAKQNQAEPSPTIERRKRKLKKLPARKR